MKILVIHNKYQQSGGECIAVKAEQAMLKEAGHEVISYIKNSADILNYSWLQKAALIPKTIYNTRVYQEIKSIAQKHKPDAAHIHNTFPIISPSIYYALKKQGIPIVQTVHNFRLLCPNGLFFTNGENCEMCKHGNTINAVFRKCYRKSYTQSMLYALTLSIHRFLKTFTKIDQFITLTEFTKQKLVESKLVSANKITVLGNFLPDPLPNTPSEDKHNNSYFLFIGRLSPEKGLNTLLKAMKDLPKINLKIAGEGPERSKLEQVAKNLGLTNVKFLGQINGKEKWQLLSNASGTIIPSLCYENFPITLLESMGSGAPVIAPNFGSFPFILENMRSGLLFEAGNTLSLKEKIEWIIANKKSSEEMGLYGRTVIENSFSKNKHYEGLINIYEKVLR